MQNNQDQFNKRESAWTAFHKSCLGRIIIATAVMLLLMLISFLFRPSEEKTMWETRDNIHQLILDNDSSKQDEVDNTLASIGYIFTDADTLESDTIMRVFDALNQLEFRKHAFYTDVVLHNTRHVMGKVCSIGFWGMVIPTVEYKDLVLDNGVMRNEYNPKEIQTQQPADDYMGTDPDLDVIYEDQF